MISSIFKTLIFLLSIGITLKADQRFPFPGEKPLSTGYHFLFGATIHIDPYNILENASLVIKNGTIEKIGKNITIPSGYREWNCTDKTIYAGFIDPYFLNDSEDSKLLDLGHDQFLHATSKLAFQGLPSTKNTLGDTGFGFETAGVTPERKKINDFQPDPEKWKKLRENGFTTIHLAPSNGIFRGTGPCVLLEDKDPAELVVQNEVAQIIAFDPVGRKHSPSIYPNSLMGVISVIRQTFLELSYSNAMLLYQEKKSSTLKYQPHAGIRSLSRSLNGKQKIPIWFEPGSCLMTTKAISLSKELKISSPVLVASGDEWKRPDLSLSPKHDYILPLLFPEAPKLPNEEDWEQISLEQLRAWDHAPSLPSLISEKARSLSITSSGSNLKQFQKKIYQAINRGLSEQEALAALTTNPARICGIEKFCGTLKPGKLANFIIVNGKTFFNGNSPIHSTWIRGKPWLFYPDNNKKDSNSSHSEASIRIAKFPQKERKQLKSPRAVLFKNFKIWTCGKAGFLEDHDVYVKDGKINSVGSSLSIDMPKDSIIIHGKGKHLTPGIIDCHSHAMILGGVNESTLPSTAMVQVKDVINSESANIERQLAGGVTTCNLLHGSANPIGGQNAVIKLKLGCSPEEMIFKNAPGGIKFALGENVKQANWGDKYVTRFPQSRMGVKTFFENRFNAALEYERKLKNKEGVPTEPNLELDALLEVISGKRLIHCHSYRQDEIVVFLRTMERFGVKVGSLQHVLEGYKVADEIAMHGAGASTFSDWWAYKFEVYDAIPYAGSIMHKRGCLVSFNSDSPDHARRMNFEAAKAVKYGNLSEQDAFNLITINPAKQLGIDRWTGSIEVGKDADFAIWSGHPFDYRSKCDQTWVEGKLYHDLDLIKERNERKAEEKQKLLALAKIQNSKIPNETISEREKQRFFRYSLESICDFHIHSCRTGSCIEKGGKK